MSSIMQYLDGAWYSYVKEHWKGYAEPILRVTWAAKSVCLNKE